MPSFDRLLLLTSQSIRKLDVSIDTLIRHEKLAKSVTIALVAVVDRGKGKELQMDDQSDLEIENDDYYESEEPLTLDESQPSFWKNSLSRQKHNLFPQERKDRHLE